MACVNGGGSFWAASGCAGAKCDGELDDIIHQPLRLKERAALKTRCPPARDRILPLKN